MAQRRLLVSHILLRHGDRSCLRQAEKAGTQEAARERSYWNSVLPSSESLAQATAACPLSDQAQNAAASKYSNQPPFGQLTSRGVQQLVQRGRDTAERLTSLGVAPSEDVIWEVFVTVLTLSRPQRL